MWLYNRQFLKTGSRQGENLIKEVTFQRAKVFAFKNLKVYLRISNDSLWVCSDAFHFSRLLLKGKLVSLRKQGNWYFCRKLEQVSQPTARAWAQALTGLLPATSINAAIILAWKGVSDVSLLIHFTCISPYPRSVPMSRAQKYMKIIQFPSLLPSSMYCLPIVLNTRGEERRRYSHLRIQSLTAETQIKPALF